MRKDRTIRGKHNKVIGTLAPLAATACPWHKPSKLTMLAWYSDSERRKKAGQSQRQCPACGHWYWPDEFGVKPKGTP